MRSHFWSAMLVSLTALPGLAVAQSGSTSPSATTPPPAAGAPATPPAQPFDPPPHWFERTTGPAPIQVGPWQIQPTTLGELYLRADAGVHHETGFPDREGLGLEGIGRLYAPGAPWLSLVGELRDEILTHGNRLSWTVGGVIDQDLYKFALGVDGIYDTVFDSHVGSGFIYLSRELIELNSYFGFWTTFALWDDVVAVQTPVAPFLVRETRLGVKPLEQFMVFYAARLGLDGEWGELYVAPGFEFDLGEFQIAAGYQVTVMPHVDLFIHYYQMADNDNWSLFGGVQLHIGTGPSRPFDFTMPNRIRARQRWGLDTYFYFVD
ncbi:MAG: hypothetical protein NZM31_06080 [Gemmatales bacterium]|nr:hypothetical protein [Gemmatales bacterium]MDW8386566.1 hypothetical protein [Gemmatales bacterium]